MHIVIRAVASRIVPAVAAALIVASAQPVFADVPLPIIDIVPQQFFTVNNNAENQSATAPAVGAKNDNLVIGGTFTEPLFKGFSFSYDHIVGEAFDTALTAQTIGGNVIYPGPAQDVIENYRADYHVGAFNVEGGFARRSRVCCPFGSFEWHKGFLGVSYSTPHYAFLNGGFFVLDVTGNSSKHYSSPEALASFPAGLSLANNTQNYTTQQAVTAIVPVDLKHGVRTATTFLWGALDYFVDEPFPYYYDVFVVSATKQFSDYFGLTGNVTNVTQRTQGSPFPAPGAIHTTALILTADFHLDFHHLLGVPARPEKGRSTQPGVPGGPGGPAPISPSQGGAVPTPAPSPSP